MPRIRNWKNIDLCRADRKARYEHIDSVFKETINWTLIETHFSDMLRAALSIKAGRISASTILLVANCLIFHNLCSLTRLVRKLEQRGEPVPEDAIAAISPYLTEHINRFGDYVLNPDRKPPQPDYGYTLSHFICSKVEPNGPFCRESLPYPNQIDRLLRRNDLCGWR
jgi:hypothetical protein